MILWASSKPKNIHAVEPQKKPKAMKNMRKRKAPKKLIKNFRSRVGWRVSYWRKVRWEYNGWNSSDFMDFNFQLSFGENVEKEIGEVRKNIDENKLLEQKLTEIKESNKEKIFSKTKKYSRREEYSDIYEFKLSSIEDAMLKIMSKV